AGHGPDDKMRHPALVLIPVLVRPVNTTHAKHECGNSIRASVVSHILICRAFRAAVGTMEIERPAFINASLADGLVERHITIRLFSELQIGEIAVDLVSR